MNEAPHMAANFVLPLLRWPFSGRRTLDKRSGIFDPQARPVTHAAANMPIRTDRNTAP